MGVRWCKSKVLWDLASPGALGWALDLFGPRLLGLQPPGGDVYSATSLSTRKYTPPDSTLFSQTKHVGGGPMQGHGVWTSSDKE